MTLARTLPLVLIAVPAIALAQPNKTPAPAAGAGSGSGGGSASAAPKSTDTSAAVTAAAESGEGADVDALRQEYLKLRDELFASRARAAAVASAMYSTKLSIKLTYTTGRFYNVRRATVRLDGANVYDDTDGKISGDDAVRFEGYVAPGRHLVTMRIEAAGKDDDRFTTTTETTAVVVAPAAKDVIVAARASDGGDLPYAWKSKEAGTYDLRLAIDVKTVARPGGGGAGK